MLEEQHLDSKRHDCGEFDCGVHQLNEYLTRYAGQDRRRNVSQVFVLVDPDRPQRIFGYYTLSAAQADALQLTEQERRRLPRYPIPCFRMGRFAVRVDVRGQGLGKTLLGCAVDRCLQARREVGAYALIVDAKNDAARAFYEHFGFTAFADSPLTLYLPLGRG